MAATAQWQHWAQGWTSKASAPSSGIVCIGPEDGNNRNRTCITVSLSALDNTEKRNELTIQLTASVVSRFGHKSGNDTIYAQMTDEGPNSGYYTIQGTELALESVNVDHSASYIYPSWTFDISRLGPSAQTVYIYIYGSTVGDGIYGQYKITEGTVTEKTASNISSVTTGSITNSTSQIFLPSSSIRISWNAGSAGTNNAIASYTAYLKIGSAPTTSNYDYIITGLTSTSHTFTIHNATRGSAVYAGVRAIGANSNYSGSLVTRNIGVINSLPGIPTATKNGSIVDTSTSIKFTVTAGNDSNSTQTLSLYYSLNNGSKTKFTSPLTISTSTANLTSGSNSIIFYTYDGMEYSDGTATSTFTVNYAPVIGSTSITHAYIKDTQGSSNSLVKSSTITYSLSGGSVDSVEMHMRTGTSSTLTSATDQIINISSALTLNTSTKTITIDISKIPSTILPYGNYFQFSFKLLDSNKGASDQTSWLTIGQRAYQPRLPTFNSYINDSDTSSGATAKNNYYKEQVTIKGTNPSAAAGYAAISSIQIIAEHSGGTVYTDCSTTLGASFTQIVNLASVNANVSTYFKFRVIDVAGQEVVSSSSFATLIKTSALIYSTSNISINLNEIKPLSNTTSLIIAHPFAQASGTETDTIQYLYKIQIGSTISSISVYTVSTSGEQNNVTITASTINNLLKGMVSDTNTSYTGTITVTAVDGFGVTKVLTATLNINFTEPPVYINNSTFKIKHDYQVANNSVTTTLGTEVTSSSELNLRMFNASEGIVFALPKASDPNNDISEYQIFLARNDFIGTSSVLNSSDVTFGSTPWLTLTYSQLENGAYDDNYYYYRYSASQYTKNEYFYFKVRVKDQMGNYSEERISTTYIIGCRTVNPNFSIGNIAVIRAGTTVTLKYNLFVTDLGGSAKSTGWDENFYNSYPNFERSITGYTPKVTLKVEISPDQTFSSTYVKSITQTGTSPFIDFTSTQAVITGFDESHAKIFMRFTLTVSYGLNSNNSDGLAVVTSLPQVYTYFGSVPTISHRSHRVGINTNALTENDVFVVENYQGSRYIIFKGTDVSDASITYEIIFDLLTGSIDGATISGGEW